MTTPTTMGNHGGTVTSCSPYAYPGFAEICILLRTWSTVAPVAPGTYELAFLIKKKKFSGITHDTKGLEQVVIKTISHTKYHHASK